ncbi:MAG TPA: exodeoxyribonuclease VII small subunit [Candidatus Saccharimonadales bacterium]|nr:exodeoxyribonuclease VII small subunit [Candidatus Saccharimonadales bacterium]
MATKESYRSLKHELDEVMDRLQQEDIDLDEALALYERGNKLILKLEEYLQSAENSIKKIKAQFKT